MTLQCPLGIPFGVKYMNLCVVEGHNDIFWRQVQTRDDSTILRDIPRDVATASPPRSIYQVPLLEM